MDVPLPALIGDGDSRRAARWRTEATERPSLGLSARERGGILYLTFQGESSKFLHLSPPFLRNLSRQRRSSPTRENKGRTLGGVLFQWQSSRDVLARCLRARVAFCTAPEENCTNPPSAFCVSGAEAGASALKARASPPGTCCHSLTINAALAPPLIGAATSIAFADKRHN